MSPPGERPFRCSLCEKAFNQKSALQVHLKKHTGERPYKCEHCAMGFTQKSNMKLHVRRAHSYAGEAAAGCARQGVREHAAGSLGCFAGGGVGTCAVGVRVHVAGGVVSACTRRGIRVHGVGGWGPGALDRCPGACGPSAGMRGECVCWCPLGCWCHPRGISGHMALEHLPAIPLGPAQTGRSAGLGCAGCGVVGPGPVRSAVGAVSGQWGP